MDATCGVPNKRVLQAEDCDASACLTRSSRISWEQPASSCRRSRTADCMRLSRYLPVPTMCFILASIKAALEHSLTIMTQHDSPLTSTHTMRLLKDISTFKMLTNWTRPSLAIPNQAT
ncbi:hypothetical protein WJX77_007276 [Trebouxia sp. C0004]